MPDSPKVILLAGALGGAAPSLLTLALNFTKQTKSVSDIDLVQYLVGTLILSVLGAGVAWAFEEKNCKKAIVLGISLPALLNVGIKGLSDEKRGNGLAAWLDFSLIPSAYAQSIAPGNSLVVVPALQTLSSVRTMELSTGDTAHNFTAVLQDSQGKEIQRVGVQGQKFFSMDLPVDANSVHFESGGSSTAKFSLSSNPGIATAFELNISSKRKLGFLQAFGAKADIESSIDAQKREVTPPPAGTEGWIYLGRRKGNAWETVYAKLPSQDVPQPNTKATVTFPLRLRTSLGSDNQLIGLLPVGHTFTILETKSSDQKVFWARVRTGL
jgi:hypothetical protein